MQLSAPRALSRPIYETQRDRRDRTTQNRTTHLRLDPSFQNDVLDSALVRGNSKIDRDVDEPEEGWEEDNDNEISEGDVDKEDEEDGHDEDHEYNEGEEWSDKEESEGDKDSSLKEGSQTSRQINGWIGPENKSGAKPNSLPGSFLKHITISDDQSDGSEFKYRILAALKPRQSRKHTNLIPTPHYPQIRTPDFALAYQEQLMLQERLSRYKSTGYSVSEGNGRMSSLPETCSERRVAS